MVALLLVVPSELPAFHAETQLVLVLDKLILPLLAQDWQLEQATLAVMVLPLTPDPASRVSLAAVLLVSSVGAV